MLGVTYIAQSRSAFLRAGSSIRFFSFGAGVCGVIRTMALTF